MSDAPERIWVTNYDTDWGVYLEGTSLKPWDSDYHAPITEFARNTEYVRADRATTPAEAARVLLGHWFGNEQTSPSLAKESETWWKRGLSHDKAIFYMLRAIADGGDDE